MLIKKRELTELSENIRKAIDGQEVDFRDNKEGQWSALKNDINTLVRMNTEQKNSAQRERDLLSDYLADISHQLKTPITSMMIMADLLENAPPEKRGEFVYNIKTSLSRMEWLVTALLKMARLDSGTVEFSPREVTAGELLKEAMQPLAVLLDVKNQTVTLRADTVLHCDRRWTAEALSNLLKNASEYSPENSCITVDSGANPLYRWISVSDCGSGIPKEKCSGLFRRFEHSQSENGFGIGLPLALSIVRGQNGDIEIDGGEKRTGSTFTVKLFR